MKPMNCISATGFKPCAARPTLMPAISVSASGVSKTRAEPKRCCRPAVARNTPPFAPTSSPSTTTLSSASSSCASACVTASTSVISLMARASHRVALLMQRRRQLREQMLEHRLGWARRYGEELGDGLLDARVARFACRGLLRLAPEPLAQQVRLETRERVEALRALDVLARAITCRVVGRRVVVQPIRQRFDDVRAAAVASFCERPLHDRMHCDDVVAVDLLAGDARGDRFLRKGLWARLRAARHRDRHPVVDDDEH